MSFATPQESFWAGNFGDEYIDRNKSSQLLASNVNFFSQILEHTEGVETAIEFGANIGMNLHALKILKPSIKLWGVEINEKACEIMGKIDGVEAINKTIFEYRPEKKVDLSFYKGVLIHINPERLQEAYQVAYDSSKKYILVAEYYNPAPVMVTYRGETDRLFKRDFAGEMLKKFSDLSLVSYGFAYHKDPNFPQDDITWFLLKKG